MAALLRFGGIAICLAVASSGHGQAAAAPLVLDGVIVAENPAHSIALVRRSEASRARPLRVGQRYHGYVLVGVDEGSVLLDGDHGAIRLHVGGAQTAETMAPAESEAHAEVGWVFRDFSRDEASARLEKEIPVILSETELSPRVLNGEILGLELGRLPDGTLLSETGLLPGDLLRSINGEALRGLDSLWDLLARLRNARELRVVVERRGEVLHFAYLLTD